MSTNAEKLSIAQSYADAIAASNMSGAAEFLADDVNFVTPKVTLKSKQEFVDKMPNSSDKAPSFSDFEQADDGVISRVGSKKIAMMTVKLLQTIVVNDDGKIGSITTAKA